MNSSIEKQNVSVINTHHTLLILWVVIIMAYGLLNYGIYWGENDTSAFSRYTRAILTTNILPTETSAYPNGYAYQTLAAFLVEVTGLSVPVIQIIGGALFATWLFFPAWLLYRELTGSIYGATIAILILFTQPEFLFAILRGTHEKFTRGLMLLALFLFIKSFYSRKHIIHRIGTILAFYLTVLAIITFNNLLATSFILAVGIALFLSWFITNWQKTALEQFNVITIRLGYALFISIIFAFLFTFYMYKPAQENLRLMHTVWGQVSVLLLDVENTATNPYATVNTGWISLPIYITLSLSNWLILFLSAIIWLWQSARLLGKRTKIVEMNELLLWAFYGAFAFIGFLSVLVDLSGAIASNLQHRSFPSFAMLAAPLVAYWVAWGIGDKKRNGLIMGLLILVFATLSVLSISKATNNPVLSNKWLFYLPSEIEAVKWGNKTLVDKVVWGSFDERLISASGIQIGNENLNFEWYQFDLRDRTFDYIISDITRARSVRIQRPLPIQSDSLITYDNGQTKIYHQRPLTPYQR